MIWDICLSCLEVYGLACLIVVGLIVYEWLFPYVPPPYDD